MKRFIIFTAALALASGVTASDWPQWRGANADGISTDKTWNPSAVGKGKVLWKKNTGVGYSSVTVVKEQAFTMGNVSGNDEVLCLKVADGSEVWKYDYPCATSKRYPGPRSTPAVDVKDAKVYVLSREGEVHCIDAANGKRVWTKSLKSELGARSPKWAFSSSPRVVGNMLLINEGEKGIALDKKTGTKIWSGGPGVGGYSSPVVYTKNGKSYVAVFSSKQAFGVDLKTGATAWAYPWETSYDVNASDPIVKGDRIFISSGYGKGCAMLDVSGKPRAIWQNKAIRSHFGNLIHKDGFVYGIDGQAGSGAAELRCVEFLTGEQKWAHKTGFGAILGAGNKIITLTQSGKLIVSDMSPDGYREVASAQIQINGKCWIMPTLAHGRIYCRSQDGELVCVDAR